MKVLFALGSEQTSKKVAERYLEKFGDELEYKNVFYFRALLDEVKSNKTYDRIVISEELEQFELKNVEALDKFIFNNIDNITDEIEDSEIIFICSDRRTKDNDKFVERLFNIGVYNTLIGDERNISSLCEYIKNPMNKKEAKRHLNIDPIVSDSSISTRDDEVEETQILSILNYYEGIRGITEEYIPAFDKIAEQYSRNQLRVILNFLPADVKSEVLSCERYAYLNNNDDYATTQNVINNRSEKKGLFGILKDNRFKENYTTSNSMIKSPETDEHDKLRAEEAARLEAEEEAIKKAEEELKIKEEENRIAEQEALRKLAEKQQIEREQLELKKKTEEEARIIEEAERNIQMKKQEEVQKATMDMSNGNYGNQREEQKRLAEERKRIEKEKKALEEARRKLKEQSEQLSRASKAAYKSSGNVVSDNSDRKKLVTFVGANKSGTTFLSNAVSYQLSSRGVKVGLLDMTRDNSLFFIYNQNDKELRNICSQCLKNLNQGNETYIPVSRNLKVYTSIPGSEDLRNTYKARTIVETTTKYNDVVIVDADISAPIEYFEKADEIYVIQDMDIMKMQDATLFLRRLKGKNIDMKKVKVIVNKYVKCMLTPKKIVEGLSYYNDPQMSFVDELLDSKVEFFMVPFGIDNYAKYIDCMYKNSIDFKKFSQDFQDAVIRISNDVHKDSSNRIKRRGIFG